MTSPVNIVLINTGCRRPPGTAQPYVSAGLDLTWNMRYLIHRMKDTPLEHFRWTAHTGGLVTVKARDYQPAERVDASSPYAAWKLLADGDGALRPGDLLERLNADGLPEEMYICKFIGFELAEWFVPEIKTEQIAGKNQEISSDEAQTVQKGPGNSI